MKYCTKCEKYKDESEFYKDKYSKDKLYYCCKTCKNSLVKEFAKTKAGKASRKLRSKRWSDNNKEKIIAHKQLRTAIIKGVIERKDRCEICNKKVNRIEAHHHDYSKPLDVKFLCYHCHKNIHKELRQLEDLTNAIINK